MTTIVPIDSTQNKPNRWFHPLSGVVMIVCDFTGGLGDLSGIFLWFTMALAVGAVFIVSTTAITLIQIFVEKEPWRVGLLKGVIAGFLCAIPTPVFGTALGSFVLIKSGLKSGFPAMLKKWWKH